MGMYASIQLPVERKEVLAVPKEAIFIRNLIPYLFKIVEGKAVRIGKSQTGAESGEISFKEIQEGDRVVVKLFGLPMEKRRKYTREEKTHMGEGKTKERRKFYEMDRKFRYSRFAVSMIFLSLTF